MAEFVCPECGSIDRVAGEAVRYPHPCPGCDTVVDAPGEAVEEELSATGKPIRVELLRTAEWKGAQKAQEPRARAYPWSWMFAALMLVTVVGIVLAWRRYPQTTEEEAVQASDREGRGAMAATPAKPGNDGGAAAEGEAESAPEAPVERDGAASARAEEDARRAAETSEGAAAMLPAPGAALSQADLRKAIPRGMRTAVPLSDGVPLMKHPRWTGKAAQVLKESDLLLVVDSKPGSRWVCVMSMASGVEGWVRADQVRIREGD
jgi:hypothetical protein